MLSGVVAVGEAIQKQLEHRFVVSVGRAWRTEQVVNIFHIDGVASGLVVDDAGEALSRFRIDYAIHTVY